MGVARYDVYQQRKCFTGMKKETDGKFDIDSDINIYIYILVYSSSICGQSAQYL